MQVVGLVAARGEMAVDPGVIIITIGKLIGTLVNQFQKTALIFRAHHIHGLIGCDQGPGGDGVKAGTRFKLLLVNCIHKKKDKRGLSPSATGKIYLFFAVDRPPKPPWQRGWAGYS